MHFLSEIYEFLLYFRHSGGPQKFGTALSLASEISQLEIGPSILWEGGWSITSPYDGAIYQALYNISFNLHHNLMKQELLTILCKWENEILNQFSQ